MELQEIKQFLNEIEQYTEEPDAFETQSEREMQKQLEDDIDKSYEQADKENKAKFYKERMSGMKRVFDFLNDMKETKDVGRTKDRNWTYTRCWIPESALHKFTDWNSREGNILKKCHLKMNIENASEGYRVTIG